MARTFVAWAIYSRTVEFGGLLAAPDVSCPQDGNPPLLRKEKLCVAWVILSALSLDLLAVRFCSHRHLFLGYLGPEWMVIPPSLEGQSTESTFYSILSV